MVIFTEKDGGARPWYLPGFSFVQDTPLGARNAAQLGAASTAGARTARCCSSTTGSTASRPRRRATSAVGGGVLERQVDRCERERRLLPNLVAVDFYERTRVLAITRRLNARRG